MLISLQDELSILEKKQIKVDDRPLNGLYEPLDKDSNTSDEKLKYLLELSNIHYNDALELARNNNISKAMELLERSLEYNPEDKEILNLIGLLNYFLCNFDKAVLNWNRSMRVSNVDNRSQYYLAFLKSDDFKGFMEYYNLAISYIDKFQYDEAIELLLKITRENKELIEPYSIIGNCYFALGKYQEARKYFLEALSRDIENVKYLKYLNKINRNHTLGNGPRKDSSLKYKVTIASMAVVILVGSIIFYTSYNKKADRLLAEDNSQSQEVNSSIDGRGKKKEESEEPIEDKGNKEGETEEAEESENTQSIKNEEIEQEASSPEEINFPGSKFDILKDGMDDFENANYKDSIDRFTYLVNNAGSKDIVAEATYYLAVSFENEAKYKQAGEYYSNYIENYSSKTYYDDSLYNYGLMLYENGKKDKSKTILSNLRDLEDTIFMNSKVEAILSE